MSCILHHWGVQLILAYSWARPAILAAGKGRGGGGGAGGGDFLFLQFLLLPSCKPISVGCPSDTIHTFASLSHPLQITDTISLPYFSVNFTHPVVYSCKILLVYVKA